MKLNKPVAGPDCTPATGPAAATRRSVLRRALWLMPLLWVAPQFCSADVLSAFTGGRADPFHTQRLVPAAPGQAFRPGATYNIPAPQPRQFPSGPLSLTDLIDIGLTNNPTTAQSWASAKVAAAGVGTAEGAFLPTISGLFNYTRSSGSTTGGGATTRASAAGSSATQSRYGPSVTLNYVLLDFGTRSGNLAAARYNTLAADLSHNRDIQTVMLAIEQAYYQLLGNKQLAEADAVALKNAETSLDAANHRRLAGLATVLDVYSAQTAVAQARLNLQTAQGNVATSLGSLVNALGLPVDTPLALRPFPKRPPLNSVSRDLKPLLAKAVRYRPDLAAAEAQVKAARAQTQVARAQGLPTVTLNASATHDNFTGGLPAANSNSISVNLNIPLFSGFQDTYSIRQAEARREQAAAARDKLYRQAELDVWQNYYSLQTARDSITSTDALVRSATLATQVAAGRYRAGVGTILDLLTAQTNQANARQQAIQAQLNWYSALARLDNSIGAIYGPSNF